MAAERAATPVVEITPADDETNLAGMTGNYTVATDVVRIGEPAKLQTADEIRRELGRVYNLMRTGRVPLGVATRMAYILEKAMKARTDVDKIKALNKFADEARPFSGLMVTGPAKEGVK